LGVLIDASKGWLGIGCTRHGLEHGDEEAVTQ
jgi:hypothetical protein